MKINKTLFDHYGIDTYKDLGIGTRCPKPYNTILIDKRGSCYACECQSWLPQSIGNLQVRPLADIIGSDMHQHLQGTMEDGTYRYCNNRQCSWLLGQEYSYFLRESPITRIRHLRLAIDDSCNLRCPSCRKNMIFHREGSAYNLGIRLADRINDWLREVRHPVRVHIGSDGDPFASHVYRHFMAQTPKTNNITYSMLTNGLLFREFHGQVPKVITNLKELGVSIDGATKQTYEKLRLGGRWEKIVEGLECMAEQKQRHGFRFNLHFVVQRDNYHEMEKIIDLGEQYGADRVYLNRIQDWGTMKDFHRQDIWQEPHYLECLDRVRQRMRQRDDKFIQCPTLVGGEASVSTTT